MDRDVCNGFRYDGGAQGHYESYFQRANHPTRPLAFWIRYTVFVPKGRPRDAVGELWAIHFDGETKRITAVKEVVPYARCAFQGYGLDATIGGARLDGKGLFGEASSLGHTIGWDLRYATSEPPLLFLPEGLYTGPFPKAKALVGSPLATFDGKLVVDGKDVPIEGWVGSQNHNWGSKHTDQYAWGQVAGFDDAPSTFLEVSTARVKLGPVRTPWMTLAVVRHEGREYRLNSIATALRGDGRYDFFRWTFATETKEARVEGTIEAHAEDFVGLPYDNPPGGRKTCLNTKIARCTLTLEPRRGRRTILVTASRAAFEILTERNDHGVPVLGV